MSAVGTLHVARTAAAASKKKKNLQIFNIELNSDPNYFSNGWKLTGWGQIVRFRAWREKNFIFKLKRTE